MSSKKISVLFVCTQMESGGVQNRAINMAEVFRKHGHDAKTVFLYKKRPTFPENDQVTCLHQQKISNPLSLIRVILKLFNYIRFMKPDAIVGMSHYSSPIAAVLGKIAGVKTVIATQTNPPYSHSGLPNWLDIIAGTVGFYTHNVAASYAIENCFSNYPAQYKKSLMVIENGVKSIKPSLSKDDARKSLGVASEVNVLINIGRLSRQKNQKFLINILKDIPDSILVIVGAGELHDELVNYAQLLNLQNRVLMLGELPASEIPNLLRAADVFLFPSLYEAFGLAVVEAMAAGVPIVCSDDKALKEVVGEAGLITPLSNEQWVSNIQYLLCNPAHSFQLSQLAIERSKKYSLERMSQKYLSICNP